MPHFAELPASTVTLFCWCSRAEGLQCFKEILNLTSETPRLRVKGVCFATDDPIAPEIERIAFEWNINVYDETTPIEVRADLGINVGYIHPISEQTRRQFSRGVITLPSTGETVSNLQAVLQTLVLQQPALAV